ncbi:transposase [Streptomyces spinoverrucosus]|uniref:Transposase n=1 Tax=Streptomyces spinoverrucosus TaxID=284043 RepID=A0A4Y3VTA5_9ACTN|nr:transposase [Streptomyces spinoverrucosus]GHB97897.1 transposase [Streptomyces spinoverrucosus]
MVGKQTTNGRDVSSELVHLTKALKAPALRDAAARLAERARDEGWTHEEYLAACLQREVAARDSHGAEGRIRAARFPSRKSLEDFDFDHQRSVKRETMRIWGRWTSSSARRTRSSWGRPAPARPTWPPAWASGPAGPDKGDSYRMQPRPRTGSRRRHRGMTNIN